MGVGTPVGAGTGSTVVRSFLRSDAGRIKRLAVLATQGRGGKGPEPTLKAIKDLCGKSPVATLSVRARDERRGGLRPAVDAFVAKRRDAPA